MCKCNHINNGKISKLKAYASIFRTDPTHTVTLRTNFRAKDFPLRVANVNAPEMNAGGEFARDYLSERCLNKEVEIMVISDNRVGKYGRLIGEIFVDGLNLGDEMMRQLIVPPFGSINHRIESFDKILTRGGYGE